MLEMYVWGMSTRHIRVLMHKLYRTELSPNSISGLKDFVYEQLGHMRQEPISPDIRILVVDGVHGRFRLSGQKAVCLVAIGVDGQGKAHLLDWQGCESESARNWRQLFRRLMQRGLGRIELLVSDDTKGAVKAYRSVWGDEGKHQLCLWHFQRELAGKLQDRSWGTRHRMIGQYWEVFNGDNLADCLNRAHRFMRQWSREAGMVEHFRQKLPLLVAFYNYPVYWRHRIRTVNLAEGFFSHLQTFLKRFPGWMDPHHIEGLLALFVKSVKVFNINKTEIYCQGIPTSLLNFNTIT